MKHRRVKREPHHLPAFKGSIGHHAMPNLEFYEAIYAGLERLWCEPMMNNNSFCFHGMFISGW
jgi:hypothetical protein